MKQYIKKGKRVTTGDNNSKIQKNTILYGHQNSEIIFCLIIFSVLFHTFTLIRSTFCKGICF